MSLTVPPTFQLRIEFRDCAYDPLSSCLLDRSFLGPRRRGRCLQTVSAPQCPISLCTASVCLASQLQLAQFFLFSEAHEVLLCFVHPRCGMRLFEPENAGSNPTVKFPSQLGTFLFLCGMASLDSFVPPVFPITGLRREWAPPGLSFMKSLSPPRALFNSI